MKESGDNLNSKTTYTYNIYIININQLHMALCLKNNLVNL